MKRFLIILAFLVFGSLLGAGTASANMCSPSNLPILSFMWPRVQSCTIGIPGAGSMAPSIPQVIPGAPRPNYVPPWGSWIQAPLMPRP
jgi:hypothetical protein